MYIRKGLFAVFCAILMGGMFAAQGADAASCIWTASSSQDWSDSGNWDCGQVPTSADIAAFNGSVTSTDANIDIDVLVDDIVVQSGYAGTITHEAGVSVTSTGNFNVASSANAAFTYDVASTGNLSVFSMTFDRGTFNAGQLDFYSGSNINIGTAGFFNAEDATITTENNFNVNGGSATVTIDSGTLYVKNTLAVTLGTFTGSATDGTVSTTYINISGGTYTAPLATNVVDFKLNASGGSGTFVPNNGQVQFKGAAGSVQSGTGASAIDLYFSSVNIEKNNVGLTIAANTVMHVTSSLNLSNGRVLSGGTGAQLNAYAFVSSLSTWDGADTIALRLVGTGSQNLSLDANGKWGNAIVVDNDGVNDSNRKLFFGTHFYHDGNFTILADSYVQVGDKVFSVGGTFSNDGVIELQGSSLPDFTNDINSGTVFYNDEAVGEIDLNGVDQFFTVVLGHSNTWGMTEDITVYGDYYLGNDLAQIGGTLDDNDTNTFLTHGFDVTVYGDFYVGDNGDDFDTSEGGTLILAGTDQTITQHSTTTFNDITKEVSSASTLIWDGGPDLPFIIEGTATFTGASGQLLEFFGDDNPEYINFTGTVDLQYLDVAFITNSNAEAVTCYFCVDSGSNTNIIFSNTLPSTGSSSGGSSTINPGMLSAPKAPVSGSFAVSINGGAVSTASRNVTLTFNTGTDTTKVAVSNRSDFSGASQMAYSPSMTWDLCSGVVNCVPGTATVYVKFYTAYGVGTAAVMDTINLTALGTTTPEPTTCSYANGTLIKTYSAPAVYQIMNGYKHAIESARVFNGLGLDWGAIISVNSLSMCPTGPNVMLPEQMAYASGNLIKEPSSPKVYYVDNEGVLHWIVNEAAFEKLGFDWNAIVLVPDGSVAGHTMGANLDALSTHPNGTLLKYFGNPKVYMIEDGKKRWITSASVFEANNFNWFAIVEVLPSDYPYSDGTNISGTLN